ncbi:unnamed protein product, partial [Prorocentrum cordatum]
MVAEPAVRPRVPVHVAESTKQSARCSGCGGCRDVSTDPWCRGCRGFDVALPEFRDAWCNLSTNRFAEPWYNLSTRHTDT